MSKVYLAGKAFGNKWNLIQNIDKSKHTFIASDAGKHSDHGWGITGGYGTERYDVVGNSLNELVNCDYMIAYVDRGGAYGTIAEIAFYSAIVVQTRSCYLILEEPDRPDIDDENEEDISGWEPSEIHDSCWFVSNFPKVIPLMTKSFEESKALVEKIASIESPIEYQLWDAFVSMGVFHHEYLKPQEKIGRYRADFLFENAKIIVELDGHAYHSSKEQRTYDAQRDRFIAEQGYQVIRFTGTEVYKDAQKCAKELYKLGMRVILGEEAERIFGSNHD